MNRDDLEGKDESRSDQQKPNKRPRIKKAPEADRNPYTERPLYRSDREESSNEGWTRSYPDRNESDRPARPYSPERRSYNDQGERPRRTDWDNRGGDRQDRGNRYDGGNRFDRGNRSDYGNRSDNRGGGRDRDTSDRPRRPWSDRGSRDDRGGQSDRPYRGGWGDRERSSGSDWGNQEGGNRSDRPFRRNDSGQRSGGGYQRRDSRPGQRPGGGGGYRGGGRPQQRGGYGRPQQGRGRMDFGHVRPEYPASLETMPEGPIRLNRYIASTGLCSRREADEYIKNGLITVNGVVISELGSKVNMGDEILYQGKRLEAEKKVYILLNKPKDYVTTVEDPNAKKTVMELVQGACPERIYPVGRLDRMTTGVLLLTNDGELTRKLTHPENEMKKIYHVQIDKDLTATDFQTIMTGLTLDDGFIRADSLDFTHENDFKKIGIEIHTGRNRIVRRIFEHFGYRVQRLDRVYFAGLTKKALKRGQWRFLTPKEVGYLKMVRQPV